ncbi:MAG: zinc ribbon domain-containing protein [Clostridia bacterium]|nr:zinc ribbon domain-containing protein [Clostridia bacterium]
MAFCKVCGAQVQDGARFCESCGAPIEQPAPQPVPQPVQQEYQSQYTYTAPVYTEAQPAASNSKGTLILAIVGAVLAEFGLIGIILCGIALGKVKKLPQPLTGANKAAKIVATIGLIIAIIMTVVWFIYFIALIGIFASGSSGAIDWNDVFDLARCVIR